MDGYRRLYGDGLCQQVGDQVFVEAELAKDLDGVLAQGRRRPLEAHLEVAELPEGPDLLQLGPIRRGGRRPPGPDCRFSGSSRNASPWSRFTGSHGTPASRRAASVASHDGTGQRAVECRPGPSAPRTVQAAASSPSVRRTEGQPAVGQRVEAMAGRGARLLVVDRSATGGRPPAWSRKVSPLVSTPPPSSEPVTIAGPARSGRGGRRRDRVATVEPMAQRWSMNPKRNHIGIVPLAPAEHLPSGRGLEQLVVAGPVGPLALGAVGAGVAVDDVGVDGRARDS